MLEYYKSDEYINAPAIKDAYRYCKQLKAMGFRLVVVTARSDEHRRITEDALDTYFPGRSHCSDPEPCPGLTSYKRQAYSMRSSSLLQ